MSLQVVIFLPSVETGGVERNAIYFANAMARRELDVHLMYRRKQDAWFERLDERVHRLRVGGPRRGLGIVHERLVDAFWMLFLGVSALRSIKQRGPVVLVGFQSNVIAIFLAKLCSVPVGVRLSNHYCAARFERSLLRRLSEWGKRVTYRFADRVVANSEELARDYAHLLGRSVDVIPNPVDFEDVAVACSAAVTEPPFATKRHPIVITAGRLAPQKNYPLLLKAMADVVKKVPCDLVMLGEGQMRPELEELVRGLGLAGCVHLLGYRENVYRYFRHADVFVLSSNYEGMPNVVIEAIGCGLPVVATACKTGPTEILCDGEGGELVPVGDHCALASAIIRVLTNEPERRRKQSIAARNVRKYSLPAVEERYWLLVTSLSAGNRMVGDKEQQ